MLLQFEAYKSVILAKSSRFWPRSNFYENFFFLIINYLCVVFKNIYYYVLHTTV